MSGWKKLRRLQLKCKYIEITPRHAHLIFQWHNGVKYGHNEVFQVLRSRRPSTSCTGIDIKQVGEVAWGPSFDCSNDRKSDGQEKGQCLENHHRRFGYIRLILGLCAEHPSVPVQRKRPPSSPALVQSDIFLFLSSSESSRVLFWRRGGHHEKRNIGADEHPRWILPTVHRIVAKIAWRVH